MTGTSIISSRSEKTSPLALLETCRAVVTVDWTTMVSAPASAATGASFLVFAGVTETAERAPSCFISSTRFPIRSSRMGSAYSF